MNSAATAASERASRPQTTAGRLAARRQRLEALQAELDELHETAARLRVSLGEAIAAGEPEAEQRRIRTTLEQASGRIEGLAAAIPLVETDVEVLAVAARAEELPRLESRADELEAAARAARVATEQRLRDFATEFATEWQGVTAAYNTAKEARRAALRAAGAHAEDIYLAEPKDRSPTLGDWDREQAFSNVVAAVLAYVPKGLNPFTPSPASQTGDAGASHEPIGGRNHD